MFYIGLDISTKCGYAVLNPSGECKGKGVLKSTARGFRRAMIIAAMVRQLVDDWFDVRVAIEGYGFANAHTLVPLVEVGTLVRKSLFDISVPYIEVAPPQLKKFTTGKGNAKKELMMLAAFKRWHVEGTNDEIDAYCLARFAMALDGWNVGLPQVNMEAVKAWQKKHTVPWANTKEEITITPTQDAIST